MNSKPMSLSRLRELVSAYGASVARFPESERQAAEVLLEISDHARLILASERNLDTWLDAAIAPPGSGELEQRLASIPREARSMQKFPVRRNALWAPAVGWAMAAALGIWIGTQSAALDAVADATVASDNGDYGAFGEPSESLLEALEEIP